MNDVIKITKQKIKNFKKAIKYLDKCGKMSFDDLKEAHRIAGTKTDETELSQMWKEAVHILPGPGHPGGVESLRQITRESFVNANDEAKKLVKKMKKM